MATRTLAPLVYRLAHPQALSNAIMGQNGFLTTAIFVAGAAALHRRPFVSGAIFGLMVFKPQLALLLPVAFLAGREWRAIAGAATASIGIVLLALLLLGSDTFVAFVDSASLYPKLLRSNRITWNELATPFALARYSGIPQREALLIHCAIALASAVMVWRSWSNKSEHRVPVLAAATVFVPPYLHTYDALLLIVPMSCLLRQERRVVLALAWLFCLLPVGSYSSLYTGPNTIPIAALLCLWALYSGVPATPSQLASQILPPHQQRES